MLFFPYETFKLFNLNLLTRQGLCGFRVRLFQQATKWVEITRSLKVLHLWLFTGFMFACRKTKCCLMEFMYITTFWLSDFFLLFLAGWLNFFFFPCKRLESLEDVFYVFPSNLMDIPHSIFPFLSLIFDKVMLSHKIRPQEDQIFQSLRTVVFLKYSSSHSFKRTIQSPTGKK